MLGALGTVGVDQDRVPATVDGLLKLLSDESRGARMPTAEAFGRLTADGVRIFTGRAGPFRRPTLSVLQVTELSRWDPER